MLVRPEENCRIPHSPTVQSYAFLHCVGHTDRFANYGIWLFQSENFKFTVAIGLELKISS